MGLIFNDCYSILCVESKIDNFLYNPNQQRIDLKLPKNLAKQVIHELSIRQYKKEVPIGYIWEECILFDCVKLRLFKYNHIPMYVYQKSSFRIYQGR